MFDQPAGDVTLNDDTIERALQRTVRAMQDRLRQFYPDVRVSAIIGDEHVHYSIDLFGTYRGDVVRGHSEATSYIDAAMLRRMRVPTVVEIERTLGVGLNP